MEREQEIRDIAYRIWLQEGKPTGREMDHWLKAQALWKEQHAIQQALLDRPAPQPQAIAQKPVMSQHKRPPKTPDRR